MQKSVLVANSTNMPLIARQASLSTGISVAEYFRDMGYHVNFIADSTSRWAQALRQISHLLGETPGDSGYPTYLASRLSQFYERAGMVVCEGSPTRKGSVSIMASVSPPGGDYVDPLVTSTLSTVQVFWGLDKKMAQIKHFPEVNWLLSTSNYIPYVDKYYNTHYDKQFSRYRDRIKAVLDEEEQLNKIVKNVGKDMLSEIQKLTY